MPDKPSLEMVLDMRLPSGLGGRWYGAFPALVTDNVDPEGLDSSLPMHEPRHGESYRLGIFLVGAYQETLGDIHNLFGDTDSIDVRLTDGGFELEHARRGDTSDRLRRAYDAKIAAAKLPQADATRLRAALEAGLTGYTYLEDA